MKLNALRAICALALGLAAATPVLAEFPDKPIKIVVGYAAGGTTDLLARALGEQLATELDTSVVIENKAGAAGSIAAASVQTARPDGYTLFIATVSSHGMNPALYDTINYDPVKGFAPVSMLAAIPLVLITDPKLGYTKLEDLTEAVRKAPGKMNFSSSGNGSPVHIAGALFMEAGGLDVEHIPYRGGSLANMAVIGGDAQFTFATLPAAMPLVRSEKVTALAVTTRERSPELPELPTMAEHEPFKDYEINTWNALMAPAGTPPDVIEKLNAAVVKVMNSPKLVDTFRREGAVPQSSTPQELAAFIDKELAHWNGVVKRLDLKIE
jgi:tripartite-type tricarboxylate transporter receptor subunit TctC